MTFKSLALHGGAELRSDDVTSDTIQQGLNSIKNVQGDVEDRTNGLDAKVHAHQHFRQSIRKAVHQTPEL